MTSTLGSPPKPARERQRITKRLVDALGATGKLYEVRDAEVIGFCVRVTPAGAKTYAFQWRDQHGVWRREKIGRHGNITAEQARVTAQKWAGIVADGGDPKPKLTDATPRGDMHHLYARYMEEHAAFKKPRARLNDDGYWRNHILPAMGRKQIAAIDEADAKALHLKMRATPTNANRVIEVLRKALYLAEVWRYRPKGTNPCAGFQFYRLKKRKRYMGLDEAPRLAEALRQFDAMDEIRVYFAALVRLSLYTGARKGEWLQARVDDIDWHRCVLKMANTKSGDEQELVLPPAAIDVLRSLPRKLGNPYIIPGKKPGKALADTRTLWAELCGLAQITPGRMGLRLHDLRHSFASYTLTSTGNLAIVGGLLRHADPATTARYGHLLDDPLRAAAATGATSIEAAMNRPMPQNVIPLKR